MTTRIPTLATLRSMGTSNAHDTLNAWAEDLRNELTQFREGAIVAPGSLKAHEANTRRRLARVYAHAQALGVYVGQPEAA